MTEGIATIEFQQFMDVQLITAHVTSVEDHPNADKLWVIRLDDGSEDGRTVCAGIKGHYEPDELVGRTVVVVANLAALPYAVLTMSPMPALVFAPEEQRLRAACNAYFFVVLLGHDLILAHLSALPAPPLNVKLAQLVLWLVLVLSLIDATLPQHRQHHIQPEPIHVYWTKTRPMRQHRRHVSTGTRSLYWLCRLRWKCPID